MLGDFDRSKFSRTYISPPPKPFWFDGAVARAGGYAHTNVTRCRVEWGMDLRTFRNGNPNAIKYPPPYGKGPDRWILEAWRPPEFFGNETQWNASRYTPDQSGTLIDRIGPFPDKGMYVFVMPICTKDGSYLPCDLGVIQFIEMKLWEFQNITWNVFKTANSYAALQEEMAKEEVAEMAEADAEADEFYDYVMSREGEINQSRATTFGPTSKPLSLWTPGGEKMIH